VLTATRPPEKNTVHMYRVSPECRHCLGFVQIAAEFADVVYSQICVEAGVLLHGRGCCVVLGLGLVCCFMVGAAVLFQVWGCVLFHDRS